MKAWNDISREEQIERWENAKRVVQRIADDPHASKKHWDMSQWGYTTVCGTVGCAAGHCAFDPWFQERGFKARPSGGYALHIWNPASEARLQTLDLGEERDGRGYWSQYGWSTIVEDFFGTYGAYQIFGNPNHRAPEVVAEEIDRHIVNLRST